jgi:hypothetical protein
MDEEGRGDTCDTDGSLIESVDIDSCGSQDVFTKDNRVAT